jgi:hypothetical protein
MMRVEIPYEEYGELLFNKTLTCVFMNYEKKFVIVKDKKGRHWRVTSTTDGMMAILERWTPNVSEY